MTEVVAKTKKSKVLDVIWQIDKDWHLAIGWHRKHLVYEAFNICNDAEVIKEAFMGQSVDVSDIVDNLHEDNGWREELSYLRAMRQEDDRNHLLTKLIRELKDGTDFPNRVASAIKSLSTMKISKLADEPIKEQVGGTMDQVQGKRQDLLEAEDGDK